jgi:hypothetical protein
LKEIGMEWDPQRSQWNAMFVKLQKFREEHGHCRVPKSYAKDVELSNWVRNQRLEYCNSQNGKKSRMTQDRLELLNSLGFRWSLPMPSRSKNKQPSESEQEPQRQSTEAFSNDETAAKNEL